MNHDLQPQSTPIRAQVSLARITDTKSQHDQAAVDRLAVVTREIDNLAANMLTGVLSPTLAKMLSDREAERTQLEAELTGRAQCPQSATIIPHPVLKRLFEEKVGKLRETLDDEAIRGEAAEILSTLIENVTIYPDVGHGPEAEVVAKVSDLISWATNDNAAPKGGVISSTAVVAGTRTERCHTPAIIEI